mmetsp:Transcript_102063/g.177024  ORF Transcript_102063/g.177024 Transcript_102063/m.177024 type:complete len:142 (-) Transcript_102063:105-530(-)
MSRYSDMYGTEPDYVGEWQSIDSLLKQLEQLDGSKKACQEAPLLVWRLTQALSVPRKRQQALYEAREQQRQFTNDVDEPRSDLFATRKELLDMRWTNAILEQELQRTRYVLEDAEHRQSWFQHELDKNRPKALPALSDQTD